jgi:hypothetical protein
MTLTKIQTAGLCAAAALVPLGYGWHALRTERWANAELRQKADQLAGEAGRHENARITAAQNLAALEDGWKAAQTPESPPPSSRPRSAGQPYVWDDSSPYVRLPKTLLGQLKVGEFQTRKGRDGKIERVQTPLLAGDGTPQPALAAALGLNARESDQLTEACRNMVAQFQSLAAQNTTLTQDTLPDGVKAVLQTAAFADEGGALRDQFQQQLNDLLGPDRSAAFWQQASGEFSDYLNNFGANSREFDLLNRQGRPLELVDSTPTSSSVGVLQDMGPKLLPPQLQQLVAAWTPNTPGPNPPGPTPPSAR